MSFRPIVSTTFWPALVLGGLAGTGIALRTGHPVLWFNVVYLAAAAIVGVTERLMPHERQWLVRDRETLNNIGHTLLNKGLVGLGAAACISLSMMAAQELLPDGDGRGGLWPVRWPLAFQVLLGLVVAELGLYAAHRLAHEWPPLWRFHALHHSVTRLWFVNTGRFHFVDTGLKLAMSQPALYLLGAPLPVFIWISGVTAFIGLLTHCNIDLRTGPLDRLFNTPGLHRWHHSKRLEEGNRNYGENLVLWDQIFGTYYNPPRRPPSEIGIPGRIATGFLRQLVQPFTARGAKEISGEP